MQWRHSNNYQWKNAGAILFVKYVGLDARLLSERNAWAAVSALGGCSKMAAIQSCHGNVTVTKWGGKYLPHQQAHGLIRAFKMERHSSAVPAAQE